MSETTAAAEAGALPFRWLTPGELDRIIAGGDTSPEMAVLLAKNLRATQLDRDHALDALAAADRAAAPHSVDPKLIALPELLRRALRSHGYRETAAATYPDLWRWYAGHLPVLLNLPPEAAPAP